MMRKWLNSDAVWLVYRLALVYVVLAICRAVFYIYNYDLIGSISRDEFWSMATGAVKFDTVSMLYANVLFIILALLPFRARAKKWWRTAMFCYYMAANAILITLNLTDAIYFHYTQKRVTSEEFFFADNDNSIQLMLKFGAENWHLVVLGIGLIAALWFAYRRKVVPFTPIRNKAAYYISGAALLALALWLSVGGIRGGFARTTRPITLSNATQYTASPSKANLLLSNPFCIVRTMGNKRVTYTKYFNDEQLDKIFSPYHFPSSHPNAPLSGRNIVFFVLESFSAEHSAHLKPELYPDGNGFTPFLDSLMRDGLTFRSAYANGHKSIEALPSILGSIPSFKQPFVLMPQSLGESRQLPRILSDEGYSSAFFCGSPRGSMGFGAYARSAGIETLYGQEDYEKRHGKGEFDGYWGIWDEPFIEYVGEELSAMRQPFVGVTFTLSSHHPFVVPEKYKNVFPAGKTKIHRGVRYTDNAIRNFFEKYSDEEWFDNTVFVFAADHVSSEKYAPETKTTLGSKHIIQFIYTPDKAVCGEYRGIAQQTDLMPTLLGLLGYEQPYFAYGRDIFNESDRAAVAYGYTTNGLFFYIADEKYLVQFDETQVRNIYLSDDIFMEQPLRKPYPQETEKLTELLQGVIQQYYSHIEQKNYIVP